MKEIFEGFNASQLDTINLALTIMCGLINTNLCSYMFMWGLACFIIHITFSKKKYKKLRENLFD